MSRVKPPRFISINIFLDACAAMAILALLALLLLWSRSQAGKSDEFTVYGPGTALALVSDHGRLILGSYQTEVPSMVWRSSRRRNVMMNLMLNPDRPFEADFTGWAFAVPHAIPALLLAIIPLWWWVVASDRTEAAHRRANGLCRGCGYDLRGSHNCCPECGETLNKLPTYASFHMK